MTDHPQSAFPTDSLTAAGDAEYDAESSPFDVRCIRNMSNAALSPSPTVPQGLLAWTKQLVRMDTE